MDRRVFIANGTVASVGLATFPGLNLVRDTGPWDFSTEDQAQDTFLRLNHNANPLGIPPGARNAILDAMEDIPHYPEDTPRDALVAQIAELHDVNTDQVVLGQGSTEVIRAAVQANAAPGGRILQANPTYENAMRYAEPFPYQVVRVPLTSDSAHDVNEMRRLAEGWQEPTVVYICNPNNPTGSITPSAYLEDWFSSASDNIFFIVDEAYYPLVDDSRYWSADKWAKERSNIVVCRTFSKLYGIAGLRIGYGICDTETAERLTLYINRSSPNTLAVVAASAALEDEDWHENSVRIWAECKAVVTDCLEELGLHYFKSHTAFLFHEIRGEQDLYIRRMREEGILVGRKFPPILSHNRLSLSDTPEGLGRFVETLRLFRSRGWV